MKIPRFALVAALALAVCPLGFAAVTPASLFQDGLVLQRGKPVPVWGTASPGERVIVEFAGHEIETVADDSGRWVAELPALEASSSPAELVIRSSDDTITLKDVLVGEVWLCSGQSNMAWTVKQSGDAEAEIAAGNHPLIRHFKVALVPSVEPAEAVKGEWQATSPETVADFSAVAYYFARELQSELGVPIGLINSSWGGTPVESWMSPEGLAADPHGSAVAARWQAALAAYPEAMQRYETARAEWEKERDAAAAAGQEFTKRAPRRPEGEGGRMHPSSLYHGMISPLLPYGLRGVIWYQGEANASRFAEYRTLFPNMITQWRKDFGQGDVPFYFVQLANLERPADTTDTQWAFQREAQAEALKLPNTGQAVIIDVGDPTDIHPMDKQSVGKRLALLALENDYARDVSSEAPIFASASAEDGAMRATFSGEGGLKLVNAPGKSFEVAGEDRTFHPAEATLDGNVLVVKSAAVSQPVAVRYAWSNNPAATLFSETGLPVAPFRSDKWPGPGEE